MVTKKGEHIDNLSNRHRENDKYTRSIKDHNYMRPNTSTEKDKYA